MSRTLEELSNAIKKFGAVLAVNPDFAAQQMTLQFPQLTKEIETITNLVKNKLQFHNISNEILLFNLSQYFGELSNEIFGVIKKYVKNLDSNYIISDTLLFDYFELVEHDEHWTSNYSCQLKWQLLDFKPELYFEVSSWDFAFVASFAVNIPTLGFTLILPQSLRANVQTLLHERWLYKKQESNHIISIDNLTDHKHFEFDLNKYLNAGENYLFSSLYIRNWDYLEIASSISGQRQIRYLDLQDGSIIEKFQGTYTFLISNGVYDLVFDYQQHTSLIIFPMNKSKSLEIKLTDYISLTTFEEYVKISDSRNVCLVRESKERGIIIDLLKFEILRYIMPDSESTFDDYHFSQYYFLTDDLLVHTGKNTIELTSNGKIIGANLEIARTINASQVIRMVNSFLIYSHFFSGYNSSHVEYIIFDQNFEEIANGKMVDLPQGYAIDPFRILLRDENILHDLNLGIVQKKTKREVNKSSNIKQLSHELLLIDNKVVDRQLFDERLTLDYPDFTKIKDVVCYDGFIAVTFKSSFDIDVWSLTFQEKVKSISHESVMKQFAKLDIPKSDQYWFELGTTIHGIFAVCSAGLFLLKEKSLFSNP